MSFENKGFANDLNSRYEAMNNERKTYEPFETISGGILKLKPVGLPQYKPQPLNVSMPKSLQPQINYANPETLAGQAIGTLENPTELPPYIVTTPKKKNKAIYYILSALILLIAIYFIYIYVKKNK